MFFFLCLSNGSECLIIVRPYGTANSMTLCIDVLFQPIFAAIFKILLPWYCRTPDINSMCGY